MWLDFSYLFAILFLSHFDTCSSSFDHFVQFCWVLGSFCHVSYGTFWQYLGDNLPLFVIFCSFISFYHLIIFLVIAIFRWIFTLRLLFSIWIFLDLPVTYIRKSWIKRTSFNSAQTDSISVNNADGSEDVLLCPGWFKFALYDGINHFCLPD